MFDSVGRIIIWYPAHLYSQVLMPTAIQQFSSPIQCFFDHKSCLFGQHSYIHSDIPFSKSIPNSDAIMPSNRAGFYDHNSTTFNSVPILEAEIRKLLVLCLHIFSQQPLRVRTRIIGRSKGLIKENPATYVTRRGDEFPLRTSGITGGSIIPA